MLIKKGLTFLLTGCLLALYACHKPEISLEEAISQRDLQTVQNYLKQNTKLKKEGYPFLISAIQNRNLDVVKALLQRNAERRTGRLMRLVLSVSLLKI